MDRKGTSVKIKQLHLKVPGIYRHQGEYLARQVVAALRVQLDGLNLHETVQLADIQLQVQMPHGHCMAYLADNISRQLVEQIKRRGADRRGG